MATLATLMHNFFYIAGLLAVASIARDVLAAWHKAAAIINDYLGD